MKRFVIGDPHGSYLGFKQCIERCGFDFDNDELIILGDICDGYTHTKELIQYILDNIKNYILIAGNHDLWCLDWMKTGYIPNVWYTQGGKATIESYIDGIPQSHIDFLNGAVVLYRNEQNDIFVHGGIDLNSPIEEQDINWCLWDRSMIKHAYVFNNSTFSKTSTTLSKYNRIFVGHTSTEFYDSLVPIKFCNVWLMDTGGGYRQRISIMDIDTETYWQSELNSKNYPNEQGR